MAEVDFDEAVALPEAMEAEDGGSVQKGGVQRDALGHKVKGRGAAGAQATMQEGGEYESIDTKGGSAKGPMRSVEGYIVFVSNLHEETQEDDVHDKFCDYGDIKNLHLNLDRRTGFVKGYALVEYESQKDAQAAIENMDGQQLMGSKENVGWAFSRGPVRARK